MEREFVEGVGVECDSINRLNFTRISGWFLPACLASNKFGPSGGPTDGTFHRQEGDYLDEQLGWLLVCLLANMQLQC